MEKLLTRICRRLLILIAFAFLTFNQLVFAEPIPTLTPPLALAKVYKQTENMGDYWVSEKLDGVRAYWNGKQLISRQGNPYKAPDWFIKNFPPQALDGELWIGRGTFEQLVGTVKKSQPIDREWRQVKYMIFDLPTSNSTFTARLIELRSLLKGVDNPSLKLVKQYRLNNHAELKQNLKTIVSAGGEGLMLHRGDALYRAGRTDDILKVKLYQDAEAMVVAHLPGQGKYLNMLGSILVEMPDGTQFRIGTGFKDSDRKNPPPIGTRVTYKYFGLTRKGIPKFASFLRVKE